MARSKVTFKVNTKAVGELLRSTEMKQDLKRRADRVAARASSPDAEIVVEDRTGIRARYRIVNLSPRAKAEEAANRTLGRAIDAARG